jgi:hypothetical protein
MTTDPSGLPLLGQIVSNDRVRAVYRWRYNRVDLLTSSPDQEAPLSDLPPSADIIQLKSGMAASCGMASLFGSHGENRRAEECLRSASAPEKVRKSLNCSDYLPHTGKFSRRDRCRFRCSPISKT